ncbi:MAG: hypothetical protein LBE18_07620 [Planctomycetaceae bacterium]|nr:hypothetical protein [Planctomycetaceae bacterium]
MLTVGILSAVFKCRTITKRIQTIGSSEHFQRVILPSHKYRTQVPATF